MKFKDQFLILLAGCVFVLSGCYSIIDNHMPKTMPQNPSNSYVFSMKVRDANANVAPSSYRARLIVDGEVYEMHKTGNTNFDLDYNLKDENKHVINYRYEVNYRVGNQKKAVKSPNFKLDIINRYVVGFECNRGKPYSMVSLLGRGFINGDRVVIGGYECETTFVSPNVLTFVVPLMEGRKSYKAVLNSENGDIGLGEFWIDPLMITATPASIDMYTRDKQVLLLSIDIDAPEAGLPLDVTTDIPDSIIMHEVSIRPEMRSARVVVEGGVPGQGSLFVNAPGFSECEIPVIVRGDSLDGTMEYLNLNDSDDLEE